MEGPETFSGGPCPHVFVHRDGAGEAGPCPRLLQGATGGVLAELESPAEAFEVGGVKGAD